MEFETKLDDETLKYLSSMVRPEDNPGRWLSDFQCLPTNESGLYQVYSSEDAEPKWVQEKDVHRYPWIAINSVWVLEAGVPMEEITPDCYMGVDNRGISLIALDVSESVSTGKAFYNKPTIECYYEGRCYFIYRLKNFIPGPGKASYESLITFCRTVESLEEATGGMYHFDKPILNFACPLVRTKSIYQRAFTLAELRKGHISPEELERKRLEGKRGQSEAAKKTNLLRKDKSKGKIIRAIHGLKASGQPVNVSSVAKAAKIGRNTVYRHWERDEVKKARGE
jgi:hypothetical protein